MFAFFCASDVAVASPSSHAYYYNDFDMRCKVYEIHKICVVTLCILRIDNMRCHVYTIATVKKTHPAQREAIKGRKGKNNMMELTLLELGEKVLWLHFPEEIHQIAMGEKWWKKDYLTGDYYIDIANVNDTLSRWGAEYRVTSQIGRYFQVEPCA